jgi:hypothetical protein
MGKFIVGLGLVVMLSAVAFYSFVANDPAVPVSAINATALPGAFWVFLAGTLIAIMGGLQGRR